MCRPPRRSSIASVNGPDTLTSMHLRPGPTHYGEGMAEYDDPFALMDGVEGFIEGRRRSYAAA